MGQIKSAPLLISEFEKYKKKMKILGKHNTFQDAFFNLQKLPVYMQSGSDSKWFLTDDEKTFNANSHRAKYGINDITYKFNKYGFRSIEFDHDPDMINVLVVGESNSIGIGLPFEEVWFNVLEKRLREEGLSKIKFFNMSAGAVTLDQMAIMINQSYDKLKPDYTMVIGPSFFASSYFRSEPEKSTDFLHFSLTARFDSPDGKLIPDNIFIPPELHDISSTYSENLNLANCFFKSLFAYSFIKRICAENFLIYFRNPTIYNINVVDEITRYDSDFPERFLHMTAPLLSPMTCPPDGFARDFIHVGKDHHIKIANFNYDKLKNDGTLEKWKMKLSQK